MLIYDELWSNSSRCKPKVGFIYRFRLGQFCLACVRTFFTWGMPGEFKPTSNNQNLRNLSARRRQFSSQANWVLTTSLMSCIRSGLLARLLKESSRGLTKMNLSSYFHCFFKESSRGLTKMNLSLYFHCFFFICSCMSSIQERRTYSKMASVLW